MMISGNRTIAKNTIFLSIRAVFILLVSLYTSRVVLNVLGVSDFGVYNVVCGFVSMFGFLNISMSNGIQRYFNYELGRNGVDGANAVYVNSVKIQILLTLLVIVVSETLGLWFLHNKMVIPADRMHAASWIFQMAVISFVFLVMQVPYSAAVLAHEKMSLYSLVSIIDVGMRLGIVFLLQICGGDKLILYGTLVAFVGLTSFLIQFVYCKISFSEIKIKKTLSCGQFTAMLSFSGWNMVGSFAVVMKEQGLNILLNLFFGPVVNAARGIAFQVSTAVQRLIENINTAVRPQLIQSYAHDDISRTNRLVFSTSKMSILFLYIISLPLLLELEYIITLWLGPIYPEHTLSFIHIVIITSFLGNLSTSLSILAHAVGKLKKYQLITSSIELLILPLAYLAYKLGAKPESGFMICFVMMLFSHIASMLIIRTLVTFSIKDYCLQVILPFVKVVLITAAIPMIPHFLMEESFLRLVSVTLISIITICISTYLWGLNQREKDLIDNMIGGYLTKIKKNKA